LQQLLMVWSHFQKKAGKSFVFSIYCIDQMGKKTLDNEGCKIGV
jgi:hypothetical protein